MCNNNAITNVAREQYDMYVRVMEGFVVVLVRFPIVPSVYRADVCRQYVGWHYHRPSNRYLMVVHRMCRGCNN